MVSIREPRRVRGGGRAHRRYRQGIRWLAASTCPPVVGIIGQGEGIEIAEVACGLRSTVRRQDMPRRVVVFYPPNRRGFVEGCEGAVVGDRGMWCNLEEPAWPDAVRKAVAKGRWLPLVLVPPGHPPEDAEWVLRCWRGLGALVRPETTVVVARPWEKRGVAVEDALTREGWGGVVVENLAVMQRLSSGVV